MDIFFIVLFVAVGFIFIVIELFIVPGFSVPGLVGLTMIGYGIFRAHMEFGTMGALTTLTISVIGAIIMMRMAFKSKMMKAMALDHSQEGTSAVDDYSLLIGCEGETLTNLRPSGTAMINGKRCDVVADGEFIDENTPVKVQNVKGTRIIVIQLKRG